MHGLTVKLFLFRYPHRKVCSMKVVSVNIGEKKTVSWLGKSVETGIYKFPVEQPIFLGKTDVKNDAVVDRRYHGGIDKACYIYSADAYPAWKEKYPDLDWTYGMFGENITVEGLNEKQLQIGDIFRLGDCRVQITQPRQPCFKLGIRFNTQKVVKEFIRQSYSGIYVKVIDEGAVNVGDTMELSERLHNTISVNEVWKLCYGENPNQTDLAFALELQHLAEGIKKDLRKRYK